MNLTVFVIVPAPGACTLEDGLVGTLEFVSSFKFLFKVLSTGACTLLFESVVSLLSKLSWLVICTVLSDGTSDDESKP